MGNTLQHGFRCIYQTANSNSWCEFVCWSLRLHAYARRKYFCVKLDAEYLVCRFPFFCAFLELCISFYFPLHKVQGQKCSLIIDNHLFPEDKDVPLTSGSQLAHCSEVASALSTVEVDLTQKRIFLFNYRGNVTVVDPEGTVRVYKKNPTTQEWEPFFRMHSPLPFLATARPRDPDHHVIYGITTQGTILRLEDNGPNKSWTLIKDYDRLV